MIAEYLLYSSMLSVEYIVPWVLRRTYFSVSSHFFSYEVRTKNSIYTNEEMLMGESLFLSLTYNKYALSDPSPSHHRITVVILCQ